MFHPPPIAHGTELLEKYPLYAATAIVSLPLFSLREKSYFCRRCGPHLFIKQLLPQGGQKNWSVFGFYRSSWRYYPSYFVLLCSTPYASSWLFFNCSWRDERSAPLYFRIQFLTAFSVEKIYKVVKVRSASVSQSWETFVCFLLCSCLASRLAYCMSILQITRLSNKTKIVLHIRFPPKKSFPTLDGVGKSIDHFCQVIFADKD